MEQKLMSDPMVYNGQTQHQFFDPLFNDVSSEFTGKPIKFFLEILQNNWPIIFRSVKVTKSQAEELF
jgi:hypothetical protein